MFSNHASFSSTSKRRPILEQSLLCCLNIVVKRVALQGLLEHWFAYLLGAAVSALKEPCIWENEKLEGVFDPAQIPDVYNRQTV